ncbi:hypothetical protein IW262DRAFT_846420 [Armillaria fumosa]|nr:hypothetical protein IW262DRAFT_846420 [Armillaria fumosa]
MSLSFFALPGLLRAITSPPTSVSVHLEDEPSLEYYLKPTQDSGTWKCSLIRLRVRETPSRLDHGIQVKLRR